MSQRLKNSGAFLNEATRLLTLLVALQRRLSTAHAEIGLFPRVVDVSTILADRAGPHHKVVMLWHKRLDQASTIERHVTVSSKG